MAQPQSPRIRALVPALLLLLGLSPAPVMAQANAPPGAEQVLGGARFAVPPGWAGMAQNGVWQGRRDFAGERGRRGAALLQVARPVAETYASIGRRYGSYASRGPTVLALGSLLVVSLSPPFRRALGVPDVGRSLGVTKPEKGMMEQFKQAFLVPWPKTLRCQVTENRRA